MLLYYLYNQYPVPNHQIFQFLLALASPSKIIKHLCKLIKHLSYNFQNLANIINGDEHE